MLLFLGMISALWADGHRILTESESTESESDGDPTTHLGYPSKGEMLATEMREAEDLEAAIHR